MGTPRASAGQQAEESTIATGTVKFFSTYRGYGFIQPSDSSPDIFVHISVVQRAGLLRRCDQSREIGSRESEGQAIPSVADPRAFSPNSGHWSSSTTPSCATWRAWPVAGEERAPAGRTFRPDLIGCLLLT